MSKRSASSNVAAGGNAKKPSTREAPPRRGELLPSRFYERERDEILGNFFPLQNTVYGDFFSDKNFDEDHVNLVARGEELKSIVREAFREHGVKGYGNNAEKEIQRLSRIVDLHVQRIQQNIPIEEFKGSQPPPPAVRIGPMDYPLTPTEFDWFQQVCQDAKTTTHEWIKSNMSQTTWFDAPIENGHWVEFSWGYVFYGSRNTDDPNAKKPDFAAPKYPDFSVLTHLRDLSVQPTTAKLELGNLGNLERLAISGETIEHVVLRNCNPTRIRMSFCQNLAMCDITEMDVTNLRELDVKMSKKVALQCTEAQYLYSTTLKVCRIKKKRVVSPVGQIHELVVAASSRTWDTNRPWFQWVAKQPLCDVASALHIYWQLKPLDEDSEEDSGRQKLRQTIEKRVKQKKYQHNSTYSFHVAEYVDADRMHEARVKIAKECFMCSD